MAIIIQHNKKAVKGIRDSLYCLSFRRRTSLFVATVIARIAVDALTATFGHSGTRKTQDRIRFRERTLSILTAIQEQPTDQTIIFHVLFPLFTI